jgi:hypothetical protein
VHLVIVSVSSINDTFVVGGEFEDGLDIASGFAGGIFPFVREETLPNSVRGGEDDIGICTLD